MRNSIITNFEKQSFAAIKELPDFRPGDTVNVHYKLSEGGKTRIQKFEGVVIRRRKGGADASFTVRKVSSGGYGVERVFPLHSINIDTLEVRQRGVVRKSRLYYLRDRAGKAARIKAKFHEEVAPAAVEAKSE